MKLKILIWIFIGILVIFFVLLVKLFPSNASYLEPFSEQLYNCKLPDNTQLIEQHAVYGKLYGTNGEHTDFLGERLESRVNGKHIQKGR